MDKEWRNDLKMLNEEMVTPENLKEWYHKKFPSGNPDEFARIVNKVLEWRDEQ